MKIPIYVWICTFRRLMFKNIYRRLSRDKLMENTVSSIYCLNRWRNTNFVDLRRNWIFDHSRDIWQNWGPCGTPNSGENAVFTSTIADKKKGIFLSKISSKSVIDTSRHQKSNNVVFVNSDNGGVEESKIKVERTWKERWCGWWGWWNCGVWIMSLLLGSSHLDDFATSTLLELVSSFALVEESTLSFSFFTSGFVSYALHARHYYYYYHYTMSMSVCG